MSRLVLLAVSAILAATFAAPTTAATTIAAPVEIAAAGDIACQPPYATTSLTCQHAATARLITTNAVDAVLPLGDTQYESGLLGDFQQSYDPTWGTFKAKTYPAIGNHEYRDNAQGFLSYFGPQVPNARVWYARDVGSWRVYVLNTNCRRVSCAAENRWLKRDIAAHPRRCSLATMHHPRFSSGDNGNNPTGAPFWPTLDRNQVDIALAGHDHSYERFAPKHNSGAVAASGVRSFVVGTGGKSRGDFTGTGAPERGSRFRYSGFGVLFLTLGDGTYTWRYRTTAGTVLDSGSATCV